LVYGKASAPFNQEGRETDLFSGIQL